MDKIDTKLRDGFRVVGKTTFTGSIHSWYWETLELANKFGSFLAKRTKSDVDIHHYLGTWEYDEKTDSTIFIPKIDH